MLDVAAPSGRIALLRGESRDELRYHPGLHSSRLGAGAHGERHAGVMSVRQRRQLLGRVARFPKWLAAIASPPGARATPARSKQRAT